MRYLILLAFIPPMLLGYVGFSFTLGKLNAMRQIRGWKPGAKLVSHVVTDKAILPRSAFCLAWDGGDINVQGNHRLNFSREMWDEYSIGDEIEIVYLENDRTPHHRNGIYASNANFVFDSVILAVEFAMMAVPFVLAIRTLFHFRKSERITNVKR